MLLENLKLSVHQSFLRVRNLDRFINTSLFQELWEKMQDNQRRLVTYHIEKRDVGSLRSVIRDLLLKDITAMPIRDLRKKASQLKVRHYGEMSRQELVHSLLKIEEEYKK